MRIMIDEIRDNLTDTELAKIILFIRHSVFLPENNKISELREIIMRAIFGDFADVTSNHKRKGGGDEQNRVSSKVKG